MTRPLQPRRAAATTTIVVVVVGVATPTAHSGPRGISSQLQVTEHGPESLLRAMIYRFLGKDSVRGARVVGGAAGEGEL